MSMANINHIRQLVKILKPYVTGLVLIVKRSLKATGVILNTLLDQKLRPCEVRDCK